MLNGGSMVWEFCVYFVYMIPLETDVLRKHRFQKRLFSVTLQFDPHFVHGQFSLTQFRRKNYK